ncbi:MAG: AI-2E family transporter [Sulfuricellaceae bacterium]|nr:AI-2E family transporter [Sulfuricellaceae bacterium]
MRELTSHPLARRVLLALFLAALLIGVWLVLAPFLVPIAWAGILAYSSWPAYSRLLRALHGRANIAALLMTLIVAAVAVIPVLWLLVVLKGELSAAAGLLSGKLMNGGISLPRFVTDLPLVGPDIADWFARATADPVSFKAEIHTLFAHANQAIVSILGGIGRNLAKMGFALLTLFFAYRSGAGFMEQFARVLESMLGTRVRGYLDAVGGATRGVLYGIVLTALVQGAVAGLGYWAAGLQAPAMLAAITVLFAMIPFGTPLVWGSLGLWLLLTGETGAGVGLLLWGALAVSWVDNVVRPLVLAQSIKIPFILAFFGVLGGLAAFGLVGLFLGPVILAVAFAVWREWLEERSEPPARSE